MSPSVGERVERSCPLALAHLRRASARLAAGLLLTLSACSGNDLHDAGSAGAQAQAPRARDDAAAVGGAPASAGRDAGKPAAPAALPTGASDDADAGPAARDASQPDGPTGAAFDPSTGRLDVDYARYLSKHDVVYDAPNPDPLKGLTVGNGRVGAMVWNDQGLSMQLSNVDGSQQSAFAAGLAQLSTTPALATGADSFQQRLVLYDGVLTTQYGPGRTITIMGAPQSELLGIHVEDPRRDVESITFELSLWDVSKLDNSGAVRDLDTWKTVASYADASGAGLSRGQNDPDHFGYTLAATVEGATFTTQAVSSERVRVSVAPSASYTIWIACAARVGAPKNDSLAQARALLQSARDRGYASTLEAYRRFWHDFWSRSFVQYQNAAGNADYLENFYYLASYVIAAGSFGKYPFHFINGVFRATQDKTKWSNAYWYWNQRDVYNSFFASDHADLIRPWNALYSDQRAVLAAYTKTRYGIDGLWVPETMGWNSSADGTTGSDFTKNIYSTGAEAALNMYRYHQYTGDLAYLRDTAYPFMREVVKFYRSKLSRDSASGRYFMASSNAHETYWNVPNAITDLAAVRSLFPIAIATSAQLGLDADARVDWQQILEGLAPFSTDSHDYLPHDPPVSQTHNGENVVCELIWPYDLTGIGAPDYARALSSWKNRPFPYGNVWANDAIQAARLGLGDEAMRGMVTMLNKYQRYPNGMTDNDNGVFEYFGVHLSALNEALLQSYDGRIRIFPALPSDPAFVARFTLAAVGGALVSAEREANEIKYVALRSRLGNPIRLINPWPGARVQVRRSADDAILLQSAEAELSFATTADASYVVERTERPFATYVPAHIEAARSADLKRLPGSTCTLGLPRAKD